MSRIKEAFELAMEGRSEILRGSPSLSSVLRKCKSRAFQFVTLDVLFNILRRVSETQIATEKRREKSALIFRKSHFSDS